jgi:hypothetical protein
MRACVKGNRLMGSLVVFSCVLAITGCSSDKGRAIEETRRNLKDPDSAKFGEVAIVDNSQKDGNGYAMKTACVTVNAKNAYGGYTGDQQAMVLLHGDQSDYLGTDDLTLDQCVQVAKAMGKK